ncbi:TetR/AcrR family transcriptional regulator [Paenibacillus sp. TAB 01]|uniref:TetR/AcrR family transcriptional regulator n=1 Tax=Paenibacillus sp. TAB 01 TaxID=3368988 RepID=UPI003753C567
MTMERAPLNKRAAILKAACQFVREKGAAQLTLEAVAKEAGVSKGGLLYHFPSKEALIQGVMEDFLDRFDRETELESVTNAALSVNRWAQAYMIKTFQLSKDGPRHELGRDRGRSPESGAAPADQGPL